MNAVFDTSFRLAIGDTATWALFFVATVDTACVGFSARDRQAEPRSARLGLCRQSRSVLSRAAALRGQSAATQLVAGRSRRSLRAGWWHLPGHARCVALVDCRQVVRRW